MRVILAKSAGFCYGVERAVKLAEQTARDKGGCVMLGSIIHNAHVVQGLAALGARQVDDPAQVQAGDTVIIRSHGEKKQVYQQLEAAGASIVDATCPNVRRIQRLVAQAEEQGRTPLIIGEQHHPEVIGAASWAYLGKPPAQLSYGEAALLAVLCCWRNCWLPRAILADPLPCPAQEPVPL